MGVCSCYPRVARSPIPRGAKNRMTFRESLKGAGVCVLAGIGIFWFGAVIYYTGSFNFGPEKKKKALVYKVKLENPSY